MTGAKRHPMNFRQALGFFAIGAVFALVPNLAPGLCSADGVDGSSGAIWLQIMSFILMGISLTYFAHRTLIGLASLLEYTPPTLATGAVRVAQPASAPVPALSPIRVALKGGLLDQRRVA
jgi:hypothetical protein